MVSLVVCIPALTEEVSLEWAIALRKLVLPPNTSFIIGKGRPIHRQREALLREALQQNPDYILFIDTDIVPCRFDSAKGRLVIYPNAVMDMIEMREPAVTALYWQKRGGWNVHKLVSVNPLKFRPMTIDEIVNQPHPPRCAACGLGFFLLEAKVLERLSRPWFDWVEDEDGTVLLSEDLYFTWKITREFGFGPAIAHWIVCKHIVDKVELLPNNVVNWVITYE